MVVLGMVKKGEDKVVVLCFVVNEEGGEEM